MLENEKKRVKKKGKRGEKKRTILCFLHFSLKKVLKLAGRLFGYLEVSM